MSETTVVEEKKTSTLWCPECQSGITGLKPVGSWKNYKKGDQCPLCVDSNRAAERKAYMNNMEYSPKSIGTLWEAADWEAEIRRQAEITIEHRRRNAPKQVESPDLKIQRMKIDHEREMTEMREQMDNLLNQVQKFQQPASKEVPKVIEQPAPKQEAKEEVVWEPVNHGKNAPAKASVAKPKSSGSSETLKGGK